MVNETYVRLLCPNCEKHWERNPRELPAHDTEFTCPECHTTRKTAEFMRTDHDLDTLKRFQ